MKNIKQQLYGYSKKKQQMFSNEKTKQRMFGKVTPTPAANCCFSEARPAEFGEALGLVPNHPRYASDV